MTLKITWTSQFTKDYKQAMKRGLPINELDNVIRMLSRCETLPAKYKDHYLTGTLRGSRECHIRPDWLLIYKISEDLLILTLIRTGTHAELFNM